MIVPNFTLLTMENAFTMPSPGYHDQLGGDLHADAERQDRASEQQSDSANGGVDPAVRMVERA
ncbi:MAG: hypothetical protein EGP85_15125 [Bifidobacterium bifidum]|nr:hypothetical protein [Bifidobacterium bifidum]